MLNRLFLLIPLLLAGASASAVQEPAVVSDTIAQRALACVACHGAQGRATRDGFYPRIAGKPAGYLYNQLLNFRDGRRQNPAMAYMVRHLSDEYLRELAAYFSRLDPPYPPAQPARLADSELALARQLVLHGDPGRKLPACVTCHGQQLTGTRPAIPGLLGLSRDYLNAQFGAWKSGARKAASPDCMAQISQQLTQQEVGAISSWLSSQPLPVDHAPAAALVAPLPVPCGGVQP